MAGATRYLLNRDGRFFARLVVPKDLRRIVGKTELRHPLGPDRRTAMKHLPGAVAVLQHELALAERKAASQGAMVAQVGRYPLTPDQIAASHYRQRIAMDEALRNDPRWPSLSIDDQHVADLRAAIAGTLDDQRLAVLVGEQVERFRQTGNHTAAPATDEWRMIARAIAVGELEALARTVERDEGNFAGKPEHPLIANAAPPDDQPDPVPIKALFKDYIATRQALGKHKDGARGWEAAILHLVKFLGHSDARQITKRNLLDWRDKLLVEGKSPKTIANKYLASVRALLRWAFENDRLPTNEAEAVRQPVAKAQRTRERGYTTPEAVAVLKFSTSYTPKEADNPANRESAHITAAKRWLPILCAFTGARVAEMAQLRKEDVRQEGDRWVVRITPDAGSVKAGGYRDVPLHRQVVALGFADFIRSASAGPLFHGGKKPERYLASARVTAGRVSQWLQEADLVPEGVQPSHGWRHRFKSLTRELGLSDRIADAIQGHAGKTASDDYGDVSVVAKARVIDALPDYKLP
ncbi:site-specific integrase [Paracoccus stylophorae]|uniref:Site-specific integrase n=1 Tax=Paracoccus stylophorae TaxID=659350 RepID=A0ABY7SRF1_9RHOB|nr:integrase [Paracoccus stylophorae]WCR09590.1 site-specific integrase [Paracoccus stylophorae]